MGLRSLAAELLPAALQGLQRAPLVPLESSPGAGATFTLVLPARGGAAGPQREAGPQVEAGP